jgi:hypothetical protein
MPGCHPPIRVKGHSWSREQLPAFTQLFAPMIVFLTLVSGADQNAVGSTPHGQSRLPRSAVDVRLAGSAAGWPRRRQDASAHSGA